MNLRILQNIIESDVLRDLRIVDHLLCILWTIDSGVMPESQQSLLVVMGGYTWF